MQETKVVNLRSEAYDVYIGRGSIFGNPYHIGKDGDRVEVLEKYRVYFLLKVNQEEKFKQEVLKLAGKRLGCYCKPLACHGDIIVAYLAFGNPSGIDAERSLL